MITSRTSRLGHPVAVVVAITVAATAAVASPASADPGATADGRFSGHGLRGAGSVLELDVAGRGGTPSDAVAVALNLTVTQSARPGFATVYPCEANRPDASTINYGVDTTIANGVIAPMSRAGTVCIYTSEPTHVVADVSGSLRADSGFRPHTPERLLDTRPRSATIDGRFAGDGSADAGRVLELDVAGRSSVPGGADAVALNLTVTETAGPGFATVYPCGERRPDASTINFDRGTTVANGVIASIGQNGRVCIYTSERSHLVADVSGSFTSGYRALNPARLLDSRPSYRTVDGAFAGSGARAAGRVLELDVTGRGGVPAAASAVALNLTVTQSDGPGFATLYPCGTDRPDASTINFDVGVTVANSVIAPVGGDGNVCVYTSARTHVIADVSGSFDSGFRAQTPARLLDTRPKTSAPSTARTTPAPPAPSTPTAPSDAAAELSLSLLNSLRAQHGAGPVTFDADMSAEALAWSAEMLRSGFRHSTLGYAENVAWHSRSSMTPAEAAEQFHEMWVDSPGHFRNMIDPRWTQVGVGLHVDGSGWHGTHLFDD